jgi:hypothetical protein
VTHVHPAIDQELRNLPDAILSRSGAVFYSGPSAFSCSSPIYILGLNPGGSPQDYPNETVGQHLAKFHSIQEPRSEYLDESWEGAPRGTWKMQPIVCHLLRRLDMSPRNVPASNVAFVRSPTEQALASEMPELIAQCWPVHRSVICALNVKIIVCFGKTAGNWVRDQLGAVRLIDSFREQNERGWLSTSHEADAGEVVITLTHPSRANWINPNADPSPLVIRALAKFAT